MSGTVLLFCGAALYLLLNLFASPRVPFLIGGDQVYFWMDALRILDGRRVYQDFLQFTPAGTDLLFALLFKVFGQRMWVTNLVVLVLGLAFVWLTYSIARQLMRPAWSTLAAVLFLVPIYGTALNATHHWFGALGVLAAIRVLLGGITSSRVAVAGGILGVASFFSLTHGVAALLAFSVFLAIDSARAPTGRRGFLPGQAVLWSAYVLELAMLSSPYLASIGARRLCYFQVTYVWRFVVHAYRGEAPALFPPPLRLTFHNLPALSEYLVVYLLLGAATAGALHLCWIGRREKSPIQPILLVVLVAVFLFAEVGLSLSWLRVYAVSAPGVILAAWVVERLPTLRAAASTALWAWVFLLAAHQTITHHHMQRAIVALPVGKVATTTTTADGLTLVAKFVKPGDSLFHAGWPGLYLPLQVRNPLYFDTAGEVDMPRPSDVGFAIGQLEERRVSYVLWAERLDWSRPSSQCSERLTPLLEYLRAAYEPVATLPNGDTLWRRRA